MKIVTANGKKSIEMSRAEWEQVGKKGKWLKVEAQQAAPAAAPTPASAPAAAPAAAPVTQAPNADQEQKKEAFLGGWVNMKKLLRRLEGNFDFLANELEAGKQADMGRFTGIVATQARAISDFCDKTHGLLMGENTTVEFRPINKVIGHFAAMSGWDADTMAKAVRTTQAARGWAEAATKAMTELDQVYTAITGNQMNPVERSARAAAAKVVTAAADVTIKTAQAKSPGVPPTAKDKESTMKVVTAGGKKSIKMSRTEWEAIGKKGGWMKAAEAPKAAPVKAAETKVEAPKAAEAKVSEAKSETAKPAEAKPAEAKPAAKA